MGVDTDNLLAQAQEVYTAVARHDGTLTCLDVDKAVRTLQAKLNKRKWFPFLTSNPDALAAIGPLLFQLLDVNKCGKVTLTEFQMGQVLIYKAVKAHSPEE